VPEEDAVKSFISLIVAFALCVACVRHPSADASQSHSSEAGSTGNAASLDADIFSGDDAQRLANGSSWFRSQSTVAGIGQLVCALDHQGRLYACAQYGSRTDRENENAEVPTACLMRFKPDGNLDWSVLWGHAVHRSWPRVVCMTLGPDNSIYVAGSLTGSVDFDPGDGEDIHDATRDGAYYLTSFTVDGEYRWTRSWRGGNEEAQEIGSVACDPDGNVFIVGQFWGSVDFDPCEGESRVSGDDRDAYILKLNSDGIFEWVRTWNDSSYEMPTKVAVSRSGEAFVTGYFQENAASSRTNIDLVLQIRRMFIYIRRFDADGTLLWNQVYGGGNDMQPADLVLDSRDNIYTTGYFGSFADLAPDERVIVSGDYPYHSFISSFDATGYLRWVKVFGGYELHGNVLSTSAPSELYINSAGNPVVLGTFSGRLDVPLSSPSAMSFTSDDSDIYFVEYDPEGKEVSAWTLGGDDYQDVQWAMPDEEGNLYLSGTFGNSIDLSSTFGTVVKDPHMYSSGYSYNVYLAKLSADILPD